MSEHPIEGLMSAAMNSIRDMIDVNTIIGEPIETTNDIIIIPISKVTFGFAAGGSEFKGETINEYTKKDSDEEIQYKLPFGGGSGAAVNINPIAFLVIQKDTTKLLPISYTSTIDKLLDYVPEIVEKTSKLVSKVSKDNTEKPKEKTKPVSQINKTETKIKPKKGKLKEDYEIEYDETDIPENEYEEENIDD